jgi:hypothetical protein
VFVGSVNDAVSPAADRLLFIKQIIIIHFQEMKSNNNEQPLLGELKDEKTTTPPNTETKDTMTREEKRDVDCFTGVFMLIVVLVICLLFLAVDYSKCESRLRASKEFTAPRDSDDYKLLLGVELHQDTRLTALEEEMRHNRKYIKRLEIEEPPVSWADIYERMRLSIEREEQKINEYESLEDALSS